ncbi:Selenocysteine lyase/Cysteine desulfurase (CsdA) (PDB:4LW2) [Commensalibacter communis]|uniref:Cysteine desulfurase n=1 Tax=Commensalibacter communis TaxID=2972786 RepID=A0A9W4TNL3_9PROT|nr:SufS family cysteine desulfurase [Commensalibacter communis]CAI3929549.1 Selenocysteine lyase/Cysteine desulfurase (CsdA) (PDB:4LW2) [Commensalibacter communis]CAI3930127.1 Selenocysteine lyase/Cysteine desulfurase (CsdA) (PDB:4LW2) [Commensalibacter communis]CAI3931352.1 Selenocysteine lyase/Cysteine desulfurase (CsdA) (PDB:4LW2) [Commensalibacter communis]CAI3932867.1 Selenocysteine lyase/Cysteine desulfurase (CsdA) (PDB:4LW2) [Commensalibacter communis]
MHESAIFDIEAIRKDFPILQQKINGKPFVFLDSGASAQKPIQVIEAIQKSVYTQYANVHRGVYTMSEAMTDQYEAVRQKVADFMGAASADEVIYTKNSTEAINLVAHSYGSLLQKGQGIVITEMEHHANLVPWQMLRDRTGLHLYVAPITDQGDIDLIALEQILVDNDIALVAVTHMSNVLGTINPIKMIATMAHQNGAKILVDGSQGIVHQQVNVQDLDVDFYTFTGHKLYGPTGIGILWGKKELLDQMPPFMGGGDMIERVTFEKSTWALPPVRFEAGTQPILEVVGLGAAIDYVLSIGYENITQHDERLVEYAIKKMQEIEGLSILGNPEKRGGVIAFTMDKAHAHDIATLLDQNGIAVRAGSHCAEPLLHRLHQTSVARASFGIYTSFQEIDYFVDTLKVIKQLFI